MKTPFINSIGAISALALLVVAAPASAVPGHNRQEVDNPGGQTFSIPAHAVEVSEGVFSLGSAVDPGSGKLVEGYAIVSDKRANAKGGNPGKPDNPGNGGGDGGGETCYAFLANGANWKTPEPYIVDPSNKNAGLTDADVVNAINNAVFAWEDASLNFDIFGAGSQGIVNGADESSPDGLNEVNFANIDSPGTVGVTIVWGIFRGNPSQRGLVEWDQVYDTDYTFGDAQANPAVMDMAGVAAHEVGHAAGMGHPADGCADETMYRFVDFGEYHQRDLNSGDIAGINALY